MNVLAERDEAKFLDSVSSFVEQIPEVDHLNLFLTGVGSVFFWSFYGVASLNFDLQGKANKQLRPLRSFAMLLE